MISTGTSQTLHFRLGSIIPQKKSCEGEFKQESMHAVIWEKTGRQERRQGSLGAKQQFAEEEKSEELHLIFQAHPVSSLLSFSLFTSLD